MTCTYISLLIALSTSRSMLLASSLKQPSVQAIVVASRSAGGKQSEAQSVALVKILFLFGRPLWPSEIASSTQL